MTPLGKQAARQAARREALELGMKLRARRLAKEKRLSRLGVRVSVAVRERDAAVAKYEERAVDALLELVDTEGVTWQEAAEWCGDSICSGDMFRLRRLAKASRARPVSELSPAAVDDRAGCVD